MVAPGMLQNPAVKAWLDGIEPAWTLLDQSSFDALRSVPLSLSGTPVRLAADLSPADLQRVTFASGLAALLRAAVRGAGLKLTATGNLTRSVVAEMVDRFAWPGFDRVQAFRFHKIVNEPDFLPPHFARELAELADLFRRSKECLKTSPRGRDMLKEANLPALPAMLLHLVLWEVDLSDFGRGLHGSWPQDDIGVVLWSLSVSADSWQSRKRLTRLCTVPINGVIEATWDSGSLAMEARVLQPMLWFGLLEHGSEPIPGERFLTRQMYRKTALFDRLIAFDIRTQADATIRH